MRVLSVSSSRADVGVLSPVWRALAARDDVELHLFLTGMHRAPRAPAVTGIPETAIVHEGGADLGGAADRAASDAMARIAADCGKVIDAVDPDVMLIMGDRLDMMPAAMASLPFNTPLMHLHGGEITEGAIDDRIRHALSKLAHRHCVSSEGARDRLIAMDVAAAHITFTGAPGLDTLRAAPELSKADFAARTGLPPEDDFRLVTVHPETNARDPLAPVHAVLEAMAARPAPTLITAPNSDPGGAEARALIDAFTEAHDWAVFIDTLGPELYPNALRHAALMIGNSSSGVIEAGLFGLPVIDVGDRQKGRERGENVSDVAVDADAICAAMDRLAETPKRFAPGTPYGTGDSGPKAAAAVLNWAGAELVGGDKRVQEQARR